MIVHTVHITQNISLWNIEVCISTYNTVFGCHNLEFMLSLFGIQK